MKHPDPPSKPSELIRLALRDLRSVENSPDYEVDMYNWHLPGREKCFVCLAGAVMAGTLKCEPHEELCAHSMKFDTLWQHALELLDDFRMGETGNANAWFDVPGHIPSRPMPEYEEDPSAFHLAMEALAAEYEAVGA